LVDVKKFNIEAQANGWTPLQLACRSGSLKNVQMLLELGAKIDIVMQGTGNNLLHLAVCNFYGGLEIVNFLVDVKKFNIEAQANGWTPLQLACRSGSLKNVQMLLELGANPGVVVPGTGNNLLHLASFNCHNGHDIIRFLVDVEKFNLEIPANGWTPLQLACRYGSLKSVQRFLRLGARIDVRLPNGMTLLDLAKYRAAQGTVEEKKESGVIVRYLS
jgi:ankyrin repeat protein